MAHEPWDHALSRARLHHGFCRPTSATCAHLVCPKMLVSCAVPLSMAPRSGFLALSKAEMHLVQRALMRGKQGKDPGDANWYHPDDEIALSARDPDAVVLTTG